MVSKKNTIKRKFPYIDTFDNERPAVVRFMQDLTSGVFENLDINSIMDVTQRIEYTQLILRGAALKK